LELVISTDMIFYLVL